MTLLVEELDDEERIGFSADAAVEVVVVVSDDVEGLGEAILLLLELVLVPVDGVVTEDGVVGRLLPLVGISTTDKESTSKGMGYN